MLAADPRNFDALHFLGVAAYQQGRNTEAVELISRAIADFMNDCRDLLDTAALIEQLDLVIGVDSAVAHLTGAIGKPMWMFNRFESEWRWLLGREDSPWYPTIRILRQPRPGDWESVIRQAAARLADHDFGISRH